MKRDIIDYAQIPGIFEFSDDKVLLSGVILLAGTAGAGKTMYCRQFLVDGQKQGDTCIFISSSANQSKNLFSNIDGGRTDNVQLLNPCQKSTRKDIIKDLSNTLTDLKKIADEFKIASAPKKHALRIVVDTLTQFSVLCGEKSTVNFVASLSALLVDKPAIAICTIDTSERNLRSKLSTFAAGILEMKTDDDSGGLLRRSMRLFSAKGIRHKTDWISFKIADDGEIVFNHQQSPVGLTCTLCGKPITGIPLMESNFAFDSKSCIETYRRFVGAYGMSTTDTGLPTEAFNASFFFIDIVGLSDPNLSVKRQVQKIEALNRLISSCDAFRKSKDKKIILPTGDGMAIGFLLNPELSIDLAIQLHKQLQLHNRGKHQEEQIGVRIGLASGPVFTVTDITNVQNVWGPGIILARRVMDAGDNWHILLSDKLAEELISLRDEYRSVIKPICKNFEIKHGQKITLYSAHSNDFGNASMPTKVSEIK